MNAKSGVVFVRALPAVCLAAVVLAAGSSVGENVCVEPAVGYNCWPMIQALQDRLVCVYTSGTRHNAGERGRGTYARTSVDGGRTWSSRVTVAQDPTKGQTPVAKGLDENGDMLLWVRCYGGGPLMTLYRTKDGNSFEIVSQPELDNGPMMQITDVFRVPTVGLMALWFGGSYADDDSPRRWGVMTSADNGKTWVQRVCGENMKLSDWPTEPSAFYVGDGRIFCIARTEVELSQFQLTSVDYGKTWKIVRTNIDDIQASTPSLLYDAKTGVVRNYYYHRGLGHLKLRSARLSAVWDSAESWPESETLITDSGRLSHAGNVNATRLGGDDYVAYYTGSASGCAIMVYIRRQKGAAANWFDAQVGDYASWPADSAKAIGGSWRSSKGVLGEVAEVKQGDGLFIDAAELDFVAEHPHALSVGSGLLRISSEIDFGDGEMEPPPAVDLRWKGGLVLVSEIGGEAYYGLVKDGSSNVWKRLEGPTPTKGRVNVVMTIGEKAGQPFIRYMVNGADYRQNGQVEMPIVVSDAFEGVSFGGAGMISALLGEVKRGLVLFVK